MEKKGLSGIITTLILIAIALVAVGVVWYTINKVILEQTENIVLSEKCLKVNLEIIKADCNSGDCEILIKRTSGGDFFDGINLVFYNQDKTSEVKDIPGNINFLSTVKKQVTGINQTAEKVEVYAYFLNEDGNKHFCKQKSLIKISY
jgi:flagellin-like protein